MGVVMRAITGQTKNASGKVTKDWKAWKDAATNPALQYLVGMLAPVASGAGRNAGDDVGVRLGDGERNLLLGEVFGNPGGKVRRLQFVSVSVGSYLSHR